MNIGGIILAAGASSRMGQPKALLKTPAGQPLAAYQADILRAAGCTSVLIVLGHQAELIEAELKGYTCVHNPDWETGRPSSVRVGLQTLFAFDSNTRELNQLAGAFVLPVDTIGVRIETIRSIAAIAQQHHPPAIRPVYANQEGKVIWISSAFARATAQSNTRLDMLLKPTAVCVEVSDPAILHNVNTPADWEKLLAKNSELLTCGR